MSGVIKVKVNYHLYANTLWIYQYLVEHVKKLDKSDRKAIENGFDKRKSCKQIAADR